MSTYDQTDEPQRDLDSDDFEDDYPPLGSIDFGQIHQTLRSLALFDDTYLGMQAMNISLIDHHITMAEQGLLREYFESDRIPTDMAMFTSALSQMWIFAVYELLRTWRERIRKLIKWSETGGLTTFIDSHAADKRTNPALGMRIRQAQRLLDDPGYRTVMEAHAKLLAPVRQMAEALRIPLAKHAIPGRDNKVPLTPGAGRINMHCGAMDYFVEFHDGNAGLLNRRDLAEALRRIPNQTPTKVDPPE